MKSAAAARNNSYEAKKMEIQALKEKTVHESNDC